MASTKPITMHSPAQPAPGRIQSDRTWTPKKPYTPRREWSFMRDFMVFPTSGENQGGNFGPFNGGLGVEL
jgi:hypothetical protein